MMRVHADEEMFFAGYGLTLAPGENTIQDPEPRLRKLLLALPGVRVLDSVNAPVAVDVARAPAVAPRVKRRRRH